MLALSTARLSHWAMPALSDYSTLTCRATHDSTERDTVLLGDEVALYADAAYSSQETCDKLATFGIDDQVRRKGYRGHPLSYVSRVQNNEIAVIRSGGERLFCHL